MKKINEISFSELILIPARNKFQGPLPYSQYCGNLSGSNESGLSARVHVMIFNCEKFEEIISLVNFEIEEINKSLIEYPDKKILLVELEFFSNLKKDIEDSALRHDAPEELIKFLIENKFSFLKKENILFMSGVSSIVEV